MILITGGLGFNNLGDELLLKVQLNRLKDKKFLVLTPNAEQTRKIHRLPRDSLFTRHVLREQETFDNFSKRVKASIENIVRDCEFIINTGGGNLCSSDKDELYFKCIVYELAKRFSKRVVFGSQTIGPLEEGDREILFHSLQDLHYAAIPLRDEGSERIAEEIFIRWYRKQDDVFDLCPSNCSSGNKNKFLVGINIKGSLTLYGGEIGNLIIDYVKLIISIKASYNERKPFFRLIPTAENDKPFLSMILRHAREQGIVDNIELCPTTISNLFDIIGECNINIGMRYHFSVISILHGRPTIGIGKGEYQTNKLEGLKGTPLFKLYNDIDSIMGTTGNVTF